MEKVILKTIIYSDIFDYPLKIWEVHKWLIRQEAGLPQVKKAISRLVRKEVIYVSKEFVVLTGRKGLIKKRTSMERWAGIYFSRAIKISYLLKVVPWIKLVGVSGGLAMGSVSKEDDVDLFIITQKNRLWLTRLFVLFILAITLQRRKASDNKLTSAGKICPNLFLEEDQLGQRNRDLYTAHEVLQMKVLWQRENTYSRYLEDNSWVFEFLPNWSTLSLRSGNWRSSNFPKVVDSSTPLAMTFENLAKKFQLWMMKKPMGKERVEDHSLYFHPKDYRSEVLEKYKSRVDKFL